MKPNQLAAMINISPITLRQWASKDYTEFLTPSQPGARRSYSDQDARILAWVAMMKTQNLSHTDIVTSLRSAAADGWRNLPPLRNSTSDQPIPVVPREAVEERFLALNEKHDAILKERDELREQLERVQHESGETIQRLQARVIELTALEAELRGQMQQYTFGGHRLNAAILVVAALFVGILLTLLIVVLFSHR